MYPSSEEANGEPSVMHTGDIINISCFKTCVTINTVKYHTKGVSKQKTITNYFV